MWKRIVMYDIEILAIRARYVPTSVVNIILTVKDKKKGVKLIKIK